MSEISRCKEGKIKDERRLTVWKLPTFVNGLIIHLKLLVILSQLPFLKNVYCQNLKYSKVTVLCKPLVEWNCTFDFFFYVILILGTRLKKLNHNTKIYLSQLFNFIDYKLWWLLFLANTVKIITNNISTKYYMVLNNILFS